MSYATRVYLQRNAHTYDESNEQEPFFNKAEKQKSGSVGEKPFFQSKLNVGEPGDQYEKEADAVAAAVTNKRSAQPVVQQKKISSVQRLATPMDEEKMATNEDRMRKDKEVQEKPDIQQKCAECEEEEKKEPVQKKEAPDKEKEKLKKDKPPKMEDAEKEKEKEKLKGSPAVQKKQDSAGGAKANLSSRIDQSGGKGKSMPSKTLEQMQSSFGKDFSDVNIHTEPDAIEMNRELGAQAFTHGKDIYFNAGKFNPEKDSGKQLLAHELTHVVQQDGGTKS